MRVRLADSSRARLRCVFEWLAINEEGMRLSDVGNKSAVDVVVLLEDLSKEKGGGKKSARQSLHHTKASGPLLSVIPTILIWSRLVYTQPPLITISQVADIAHA